MAAGTSYTTCKASATDAQANQDVFGVINKWLTDNANTPVPPAGPGKVTMSDGLTGMATDGSLKAIALDDDCGFFMEPGLGLWISVYQKAALAANPGLGFAGLATDEILVDKDGAIIYMHAGDWGTAGGGMEVNFPGVTGGTILEHIWGVNNKFVFCRLKGLSAEHLGTERSPGGQWPPGACFVRPARRGFSVPCAALPRRCRGRRTLNTV